MALTKDAADFACALHQRIWEVRGDLRDTKEAACVESGLSTSAQRFNCCRQALDYTFGKALLSPLPNACTSEYSVDAAVKLLA